VLYPSKYSRSVRIVASLASLVILSLHLSALYTYRAYTEDTGGFLVAILIFDLLLYTYMCAVYDPETHTWLSLEEPLVAGVTALLEKRWIYILFAVLLLVASIVTAVGIVHRPMRKYVAYTPIVGALPSFNVTKAYCSRFYVSLILEESM
jgi:hypothetical protein